MTEFATDIENEVVQDQLARLKASILQTLSERNSTLEDLLSVITSASKPEVADAMKTITLDELRATTPSPEFEGESLAKKGGDGAGEPAKKAAKKAAKKEASGRVRQDYVQLTKEILSLMKRQGEPISTGLVTETFGVNAPTARKAMEMLLSEGEIAREGEGRGRVYYLEKTETATA